MKTKLLVAVIACLALGACSKTEVNKEEKKEVTKETTHTTEPAPAPASAPANPGPQGAIEQHEVVADANAATPSDSTDAAKMQDAKKDMAAQAADATQTSTDAAATSGTHTH